MTDETKTEVPAGIPAENPEPSRRAWVAFFARIRRATEAAVERVAESLVIHPGAGREGVVNFSAVRPGSRVRYNAYAGLGRYGPEYKPKVGRVVMSFASHLVLNIGGAHGTPAVVDEKNFLAVVERRVA